MDVYDRAWNCGICPIGDYRLGVLIPARYDYARNQIVVSRGALVLGNQYYCKPWNRQINDFSFTVLRQFGDNEYSVSVQDMNFNKTD